MDKIVRGANWDLTRTVRDMYYTRIEASVHYIICLHDGACWVGAGSGTAQRDGQENEHQG